MELNLDSSTRIIRQALMLVKESRIAEANACYGELLQQHPSLPRYLGWPVFSLALEEAGYEEQAKEALCRWQALRRSS